MVSLKSSYSLMSMVDVEVQSLAMKAVHGTTADSHEQEQCWKTDNAVAGLYERGITKITAQNPICPQNGTHTNNTTDESETVKTARDDTETVSTSAVTHQTPSTFCLSTELSAGQADQSKQCLSTDSGLSLSPSPTATTSFQTNEEEEDDEYSTIFEAVVAASETSERPDDCEGRLFSEDDEVKPNRPEDTKQSHAAYFTTPSVSNRLERYSHNPKKIETYRPGSSSLSQLESVFKRSSRYPLVEKPVPDCSYVDSGLSSKCTIRRTGSLATPTTPGQDPYMKVQSGGDIPFEGLRCKPSTKRLQKTQSPSPSISPAFKISPLGNHSPFTPSLQGCSISRPTSATSRPTSASSCRFSFPSNQVPTKSHSSSTKGRQNDIGYACLSCRSVLPPSLSPQAEMETSQKRMEALKAIRKRELTRILSETKTKRLLEEAEKNRSRRHSDFSAYATSPVALNRYDVDCVNDSVFTEPGDEPPYRPQRHPRARALYSFRAQNKSELSVHRGDVIFVIKQIDQNWVQGERHGAVGMLPTNHIQIQMLDTENDRVSVGSGEQKSGPYGQYGQFGQFAHAKFNFDAFDSTQLAFKKGDVLRVLELVNVNWFRARAKDGQCGLVPVSYLEFDEAESCNAQLNNALSAARASLKDELEEWISSSTSLLSVTADGINDNVKNESEPCTHEETISSFDDAAHSKISHSDNGYRSLDNGCSGEHASEESLKNGHSSKQQFIHKPNNGVTGTESSEIDADSELLNALQHLNSNDTSVCQSETGDIDVNFMSMFDSCRHLWNDNETVESIDQNQRLESPRVPELAEGRRDVNGEEENRSKNERLSTSNWGALNVHSPRNLYTQQRTSGSVQDHSPYIAVREYKPTNTDELQLEPGELIYVTEMFDDGWFVGISHRTNKFGMFPSICVSKQYDMQDDTRATKL